MKYAEKLAPAGALATALISLSCCLPLSIPAALGLAGLGTLAGPAQLWILGASLVLLAVGIVQAKRRRACGRRASRMSLMLLGAAATLIGGVLVFPQAMASFLADRLP